MHPGPARLALALLALAIPALAAAQTKVPLPAFIQKSFAEDSADCRQSGGRITLPQTAETAFLNGDALPDYLVDLGEVRCTAFGSGSGYCGTAGCAVGIWISMPGGHQQVYGNNLQQWRVDRSVRPNRLVTRMHGSSFGRTGAESGDVILAWNGTAFVPVKATARPAAPAAASQASPVGFQIRVTLTPQATAWLKRQGDQPLAVVTYQGVPKRGTPAELIHPAEDVILLGEDRIPLPAAGGTVRATGAGLDQSLLRHVQGPVEAFVLVRQAREPPSAMEVVPSFNCTPDEAVPLTTLKAKGISLTCGPP